MRISVRVGVVRVDVEGVDYTRRQVARLLAQAAGVAAALAPEADTPEADTPAPVGFAVVTERADEPRVEHYYTDDD